MPTHRQRLKSPFAPRLPLPHTPPAGKAAFTGRGEGEGATINVPLPGGAGDAAARFAWGAVVEPAARRFRPDVLVVSAGAARWLVSPVCLLLNDWRPQRGSRPQSKNPAPIQTSARRLRRPLARPPGRAAALLQLVPLDGGRCGRAGGRAVWRARAVRYGGDGAFSRRFSSSRRFPAASSP